MKSMDEIHTYTAKTVEAIKGKKGVTPEAQQAQLAAVWYRSQTAANGMLAATRNKTATEHARLVREMLGSGGKQTTGADAVSRRDAADRAAMLTEPREAVKLMRTARDNGDEVLAQAIARHAVNRSHVFGEWDTVVAEFTAGNPGAAHAFQQIRALPNRESTFRDTVGHIVPRPSEIDQLSEEQIRQLATSELADEYRVTEDGE